MAVRKNLGQCRRKEMQKYFSDQFINLFVDKHHKIVDDDISIIMYEPESLLSLVSLVWQSDCCSHFSKSFKNNSSRKCCINKKLWRAGIQIVVEQFACLFTEDWLQVRSDDWKEKEKSQQNNYHKKTNVSVFTDQGTMGGRDSGEGRDMSTGHDMRGHDTTQPEQAWAGPEQQAADPQQQSRTWGGHWRWQRAAAGQPGAGAAACPWASAWSWRSQDHGHCWSSGQEPGCHDAMVDWSCWSLTQETVLLQQELRELRVTGDQGHSVQGWGSPQVPAIRQNWILTETNGPEYIIV